MPTWLHVAEKPSVAKEVAHALSNGQCRSTTTLSRFNPVFEFKLDGNTMLVTSVAGHLMEDEFPPHTKNWASYPFQGLFTAKITKSVKAEFAPLQKNLETLGGKSQVLVLWLDCDREGENICFEVMQVVQAQNPRIGIRRAHFSTLTQRDLLHAMRNLKTPDRNLSEAVAARQEMDLRIGAAFTRFQTVKFGSAFSGVPRVLSFGPCQFPTVGFLVRRHWEQQGFVPEDYFTIKVAHAETKFHSSRGAIYDQVAATLVYDDMLNQAAVVEGKGTITSVNQRPTHRRPPVPLATVVMQKLASTHLHIPSERCMSLAESLYQEGLISYPRTETDSYTFQDRELLNLVQVQTATPAVAEYASAMISDPQTKFRRPLRGGHDDRAHPPIHPTRAWNATQDDKGRLYTLIARHFLATMSPDAVAAVTSVVAEFGGETFTTSGTTILGQGYLEVFTYERWNSSCIPNYIQGEVFQPDDVRLEQGRTAPPPHLTETDLIALMDVNGIGTDATIAQHIKTVLDREYVRREGQRLVPTVLGIALASAYEVLGLASLLQPQLRAQMELAMRDIAVGCVSREQVVDAAVKLYREIFDRLASSSTAFYGELSKYLQPVGGAAAVEVDMKVTRANFMPCGRCSRSMELVEGREGDRSTWYVRCVPCGVQLRVPPVSTNELEPTGQKCALCPYIALKVTNREKKTNYTVCPQCFTNPPPLADLEAVGEFRCFQCVAACPLAKGVEQMAITTCVSCGENDLRLRTGATGSYLACKGYPNCTLTVTLPAASNVQPDPSRRCPQCNAVMLNFDFRGLQEVPGLELVDTVCVSCDPRLRDYISVKGYRPREASTTAAISRSYAMPTVTSCSKGRGAAGGSRGILCDCGVAAKQLTSRKDASLGKAFLTCGKGRQCNFFQWLDA